MSQIRRYSKLSNPYFIASIVLLLMNDFVLKQIFHNVLTGKLSDFAGLFAFAYFLSCVFHKSVKVVHYAVAIAFIIFKSSFATFFIEQFNQLVGTRIVRVVDYSDYIALPILFLSYYVFCNAKVKLISPIYKGIVAAVSIFAFLATSQIPRYGIVYSIADREFIVNGNLSEVTEALNKVEQDKVAEINKRRFKYRDKPLVYDKERLVYHTEGSPKDVYAYQFESKNLKRTDTIKFKSNHYLFYLVSDLENQRKSKIVLKEVYESVEGEPQENDTVKPVYTEYPNSVIRQFKIDYVRPIKRKL